MSRPSVVVIDKLFVLALTVSVVPSLFKTCVPPLPSSPSSYFRCVRRSLERGVVVVVREQQVVSISIQQCLSGTLERFAVTLHVFSRKFVVLFLKFYQLFTNFTLQLQIITFTLNCYCYCSGNICFVVNNKQLN